MSFTLDNSGFARLNEEFADLIAAADVSVVRVSNFIVQSIAEKAKNRIRRGGRSGRVYHYPSGPHQASAPGEPPADFTGYLASSIRYEKMTNTRDSANVFVDARYGKTLEFGGFNEDGSYIAPRPFIYPSFREAIHNASRKLRIEFESMI